MPNCGRGWTSSWGVLHSCSVKCSATFLKILGQGHLRPGHRVRSSDPTSEKKLSNRVTATVVERKISNFQDLVYYQVPAACLSRIFLYWWPIVRSIVWPPLYKSMGEKLKCLKHFKQICSNRSEPCSIRLLLMTSVQLCISDPWKGHLRSNNDIVRTMYVFAYNFWLDWELR